MSVFLVKDVCFFPPQVLLRKGTYEGDVLIFSLGCNTQILKAK